MRSEPVDEVVAVPRVGKSNVILRTHWHLGTTDTLSVERVKVNTFDPSKEKQQLSPRTYNEYGELCGLHNPQRHLDTGLKHTKSSFSF